MQSMETASRSLQLPENPYLGQPLHQESMQRHLNVQ